MVIILENPLAGNVPRTWHPKPSETRVTEDIPLRNVECGFWFPGVRRRFNKFLVYFSE
jgi:hypothetical protein